MFVLGFHGACASCVARGVYLLLCVKKQSTTHAASFVEECRYANQYLWCNVVGGCAAWITFDVAVAGAREDWNMEYAIEGVIGDLRMIM